MFFRKPTAADLLKIRDLSPKDRATARDMAIAVIGDPALCRKFIAGVPKSFKGITEATVIEGCEGVLEALDATA